LYRSASRYTEAVKVACLEAQDDLPGISGLIGVGLAALAATPPPNSNNIASLRRGGVVRIVPQCQVGTRSYTDRSRRLAVIFPEKKP